MTPEETKDLISSLAQALFTDSSERTARRLVFEYGDFGSTQDGTCWTPKSIQTQIEKVFAMFGYAPPSEGPTVNGIIDIIDNAAAIAIKHPGTLNNLSGNFVIFLPDEDDEAKFDAGPGSFVDDEERIHDIATCYGWMALKLKPIEDKYNIEFEIGAAENTHYVHVKDHDIGEPEFSRTALLAIWPEIIAALQEPSFETIVDIEL